jgi:hypothetical protein
MRQRTDAVNEYASVRSLRVAAGGRIEMRKGRPADGLFLFLLTAAMAARLCSLYVYT